MRNCLWILIRKYQVGRIVVGRIVVGRIVKPMKATFIFKLHCTTNGKTYYFKCIYWKITTIGQDWDIKGGRQAHVRCNLMLIENKDWVGRYCDTFKRSRKVMLVRIWLGVTCLCISNDINFRKRENFWF